MPHRDADHWRSTHLFLKERIRAAAVYCSDGRYGEAFDEFLHDRLRLPRYDRLAVPGGAACLAGHMEAHREEDAIGEQLRFLVRVHRIERVVLVAHEACAYYTERLHVPEPGLRGRQLDDLAKAAATVRSHEARLRVEAWFAAVAHQHVAFEPVGV